MNAAPSIVPPESESDPAAEDHRRDERKARFYAGWIDTGAGGALREATVADISAGGARLQVADGGVPDAFILMLSRDGTVRRACTVMWRRGGEIGVKFIDASDGVAIVPEECNWAVPVGE
jgi:PilZ domain